MCRFAEEKMMMAFWQGVVKSWRTSGVQRMTQNSRRVSCWIISLCFEGCCFFLCSLSALLCESVQRKEHRSGQRSEYIYLVTRKGGTKKSKQQFLAEELGFHQIFISVLCPLNRGPWWWRITVHLREAAPAGRALLMKSSSCSGSAEAHRLFLFRVNNWVRQGRAVHISSTDHLSLPLPCRLPSVSTTTTEPGRSTAPLNKHVWNLSDFSGLSSALIFGKVIIIYGLFSPEEQRCFGPLY